MAAINAAWEVLGDPDAGGVRPGAGLARRDGAARSAERRTGGRAGIGPANATNVGRARPVEPPRARDRVARLVQRPLDGGRRLRPVDAHGRR